MDVLQRNITLPLWQHVSLVVVGSISLANIWHLYSTRRRTRSVALSNSKDESIACNANKSRNAHEIIANDNISASPGKLEILNPSAEQGADNSSDTEYSSEIDEVEEGEIKDFPFSLEPFKQVLCVNISLKKMDKGKAMAQCGHATLGAYRISERYAPSNVKHWFRSGQAKIAVKCTEEEMLQVAENAKRLGIVNYTVEDAGRTQIAAGSKTVCAIGPAPQSILDEITGSFKLM